MYSVGCIHVYNQVVGSSAERIEARGQIACWRLGLKTMRTLFKQSHILGHYLREGATSMRGQMRLELELEEAIGKRKEKGKKKVPTSLNGTTRVSRQTIGKAQQGTVHEHDPQKRRGCRNGQGPRYCHDGTEQMGWESMGDCHGRAMSHEKRRDSHSPRTIDITNSKVDN